LVIIGLGFQASITDTVEARVPKSDTLAITSKILL
jgi:hypothetical protein